MGYSVKLTRAAAKQLEKLEPKTRKLLAAYIDTVLQGCENPRKIADSRNLEGVKNGWRWRVGAYRILGTIEDGETVIMIFKIGHRRDVCRNV